MTTGARLTSVIVQVKAVVAVPPFPSDTVTVTVFGAIALKLTVPVIRPVVALIATPLGRPVAL